MGIPEGADSVVVREAIEVGRLHSPVGWEVSRSAVDVERAEPAREEVEVVLWLETTSSPATSRVSSSEPPLRRSLASTASLRSPTGLIKAPAPNCSPSDGRDTLLAGFDSEGADARPRLLRPSGATPLG